MNKPKAKEDVHIVLDRRVNIVSLANLAALVALLFTALGTWYGLVGRVDTLNIRVDSLTKELADSRTFSINLRQDASNEARDLRGKSENISTRLSVVETRVDSILGAVTRIEQRIDVPILNSSKK